MLFLYRGKDLPMLSFHRCWEVKKFTGRPLMAIHRHLAVRGSILVDDNARMCVLLKAKGQVLPDKAVRFAQSTLIHGYVFY